MIRQVVPSESHPMKHLRTRALVLSLQAALGSLAGLAHAETFNDMLVFETRNQSLWSAGPASGWTFDSGLIGGRWGGGRAATSPGGMELDGIVGSANGLITPEIPGYNTPTIPAAVLTPAIPAKQLTPYVAPRLITPEQPATYVTIPAVKTPRICIKYIGCTGGQTITPAYKQQVTPYIPAVYSPAVAATFSPAVPATYSPEVPSLHVPSVPAVYGDTRSGVRVAVKTSGDMGLQITASATAGAVAVTLPVRTTLNMPTSFASGQSVHVGGTVSIDSGARIGVTPTSVQARLSAAIQTTNSMTITACVLAAGCTDTGIQPGFDTRFDVVALDTAGDPLATALGRTVPVNSSGTGSGIEFPILTVGNQERVGVVVVTLPQTQDGGTVDGNVLSLDTRQSVVKATADISGILRDQLFKEGTTDIPNQPTLALPNGTRIQGDLSDMQGGLDLQMTQSLSFEASILVTLSFDQLVTMTADGITHAASRTVSFDLERGADLVFEGVAGRLVSRSFSIGPGSLLSNRTSVSVDPLLALHGGCFSLELAGFAGSTQCALDQRYDTTDLLTATVYDESFALQGFNRVDFASAVPEPQGWALLLAGLGLAGALARRRTRRC